MTHTPFTSISEEHRRQIGEAIFRAIKRVAGKPLGFMLLIAEDAPPSFRRGVDFIEIATVSNLTTDEEETRMLGDCLKGKVQDG